MKKYLNELPDLLDISTVANMVGLTPYTVRKYIKVQEIPAVKIGSVYRIPKRWVINLMKCDASD